jgi:hypothetical protein
MIQHYIQIYDALVYELLLPEDEPDTGRKASEAHFTRWFKYYRDYLCVNKSQFVPVTFEPPCTSIVHGVGLQTVMNAQEKTHGLQNIKIFKLKFNILKCF